MDRSSLPSLNIALRVAGGYFLFAAAWFLGTDLALTNLIESPEHWRYEIFFDLVFVLASAALIYFMVRRALNYLESINKQLTLLKDQLDRAQWVANIGSWDVDLRLGRLNWSDQTYRIFEVDKKDFAATEAAFLEFVHPDDRAGLWAAREAWLRDGGTLSYEHRICTATGRVKVVVETAEVFYDDEGNPRFTSGVVQDVTGQREHEAEARAWSRRLDVAAQAARLGIWEYRLQDDVLNWDARMHELYGLSPDQAPVRWSDWWRWVHPGDAGAVSALVDRILAGEEDSFATEFRAVLPESGRIRHLLAYGKLSRDSQGRPEFLTGANVDVTDWVETREQLQQAQKLEAVGLLTGGIAHDFNNHLTVVMSCLESITAQRQDPGQVADLSEEALNAAQRLAELTSRLLVFSRKQPLQPAPVLLNDLLSDMESLIRRTIPESITIEIVRGEGLWFCEVDKTQLENAMLNLIVNARDAMPQGGTLRIATGNVLLDEEHCRQEGVTKPGDYVLLSVSDTGTGIPAELLEKIFDPFFTTKEVGRGTGLGLSMVHGFVEQSGGHIKVTSATGQGTTLRVYLPRLLSAPQRDKASRREPQPVAGGSERILIVEDDELLRKQLRWQLEKLGYQVVAAEHGDAALSVLRDDSDFHLLLTDMMLPGSYSGRQLAERVLADYPKLKVLLSSGYSEEILRDGKLDLQLPLLSKPYRKAQLASKVRMVLDGDEPG